MSRKRKKKNPNHSYWVKSKFSIVIYAVIFITSAMVSKHPFVVDFGVMVCRMVLTDMCIRMNIG